MESLRTWWASTRHSDRRSLRDCKRARRSQLGVPASLLVAALAASLVFLPVMGGCGDDQGTDASGGAQSTDAGGSDAGGTGTSAAPAPPEGDRLYATLCAGCHGTDGQSGFSPPIVGLDAEVVRTAVSQGKGDMAAFGDTLSAEEIDAIVVYVGTL